MTLRLKTILGVGLIEAISLAILISSVLNYMRTSNQEGFEDYVYTTSTLFVTTTQDAVLSFDLASLDNFVEEILKNEGVLYARIKDSDKNTLAIGGDKNYVDRPFYPDKKYSDVDDGLFDIQQLITVDDEIYGYIEMGFSTQKIEAAVTETRRLAASIAIIEMLLVALFSFFLGVYLTKQLKVLRDSARGIAAGDLTQTIHVTTHDEIGEVAHSFNKMVVSLKEANHQTEEYQQELEQLNKSLEDRVKKRTEKILEQKDKLEEAYDKLQNTQEQLVQSEKMASIGQLAAGVAHEINNPVGYIKSNLSSLKNYVGTYQRLIDKQQEIIDSLESEMSDAAKEKLAQLLALKEEEDIDFINEDIATLVTESIDGTERVIEIVKGLKDYVHAPNNEMDNCDINHCLENTLKMLNNELKYNYTLKTDFQSLPLCLCNTGKITQVFTNLIVNAIQAMDDKGTLTVTTAFKANEDNENTDVNNGANGHVVIRISDTGQGIAKEHLSKLFDPFFTTKPVGEGTGLGLSISQGIIHDHHGTIEIDSKVKNELGKGGEIGGEIGGDIDGELEAEVDEAHGTTFTITLPVIKEQDADQTTDINVLPS